MPGDILQAAFREVLRCYRDRSAVLSTTGEVCRRFVDIDAEALEWEERCRVANLDGAVVAIQIGNHAAWPALLLALARVGAVVLPLGGHIGETERTVAMECAGATAWIGLTKGELALHSRLATAPRWVGAKPDFLKLTSGTTAAPRLIRFRYEALLEDARQIMETMGFGPDDLNYGAIPVSHSYGFSNLLTPLLCAGVPLVLSDDRMPRAILSGLEATGATVFPGMPVFFDKLTHLTGSFPPLPALRLCISAGAPLSPAVGAAFQSRFGQKVHSFYGSSECGGIAFDTSLEPICQDGFVGQAMSRVSLTFTEGERLEIRGATLGDGYWPPEEDDPLAKGCFSPNDLVRREHDGLYLIGRINDAINIAGRKLNPGEVEAQLRSCPGIRDVVVFGIPSALRNEEAIACVTIFDDVNETAIMAFARRHLSQWQVPKAIWIVPAIPVNERGKTDRHALAQRYLTMRP